MINILAQDFINSLLEFIEENLSLFPYMYREYFDWIRFVPYKKYLIFYKIFENKKEVIIVRIIYWTKNLSDIKNLEKF